MKNLKQLMHLKKLMIGKRILAKTLMCAPVCLPLLSMSAATTLTGCGFHLRGYSAPNTQMQIAHSDVVLLIDDDRSTFLIKQPLTQRLNAIGANVVDGLALIEKGQGVTLSNNSYNAAIKVNNVRFQTYDLLGVLTEVRQVITADVTYQIRQNGQLIEVTNPIQVQQSYQYNEASVSTDDQQGAQIKSWLYENLSQRIVDQYVALSLPKVAPKQPNLASNAQATD